MFISHMLCTVESYSISHDRPGSFGDEIVVEGWFLSHAEVRSMTLVYPGQMSFPIEDRRRSSEGVWNHHGEAFGVQARAARFRLVEPLANHQLDLLKAKLRIEFESGESYEAPIGHTLFVPERKTFSKEDHDLIMQFESMGDNCEFGLVQRRVGSERLSLLRYAGVGNIENLANAIANGFEGFGEHNDIVISQHGNEWVANALGPSLAFHTGRSVESIAHDRILREETRKLSFMAQKLIGDCEAAEKIFVYRVLNDERGGLDGIRGMDALYAAMQRHGPARLLWVNIADNDNVHGSIRHVRERLYRGYIDHLAPHWNAFDFRPQSWLDLLRAAQAMMSGDQLKFSPPEPAEGQ